jgi:hypothetical protein
MIALHHESAMIQHAEDFPKMLSNQDGTGICEQ